LRPPILGGAERPTAKRMKEPPDQTLETGASKSLAIFCALAKKSGQLPHNQAAHE